MSHALIHSSASNAWFTPSWVVELVRGTLGGIELDPASCPEANAVVRAERIYTEADDGLTRSWAARTLFANPPYGRRTGRWVARALEGYQSKEFEAGVLLLNAVPDRSWFWPLWRHPLAFFYQRIRFVDGTGRPAKSPTHGNVAVLLADGHPARFHRAFSSHAHIVWPRGE